MNNKLGLLRSKTAFLALMCCTSFVASAQVITANLAENYDASNPGATSGQWGSTTGSGYDWTLTGAPSVVSVTSSLDGINEAFSFDGETQYGEVDPFRSIFVGAPASPDSTWEFWIKPDSLSGTSGFFETGGNQRGLSFMFIDDVLHFYTKDDGTVDISTTISSGMITDFIQVVGVVDATNSTTSLYINGTIAATTASVENWRGTDDSRIGGTGNAVGGSSLFAGDIAIARIYSAALSASDITQNYNAVVTVPEFKSSSLLIGGVVLFLGFFQRYSGNKIDNHNRDQKTFRTLP